MCICFLYVGVEGGPNIIVRDFSCAQSGSDDEMVKLFL